MNRSLSTSTILGGIAAVLAGGAIAYFAFERATEKPDHRVVDRDGMFELRDYPSMLVAETVVPGTRADALTAGFKRLADYIFAKSRPGSRIAMTAPVLSDRQGGGWRTRFVMPVRHARDELPTAPAGVGIDRVPPRRLAVLRFSGEPTDAVLDERETELAQWMERRGLAPSGAAEHAFYNSPFMPSALRRNEVMIPVATA